ncbi:hypothetical protein TNCV_1769091 [Trichonephila clavipes]|nr:hypothetical protein TNCV_1769091 [Trichonephila clavipes]
MKLKSRSLPSKEPHVAREPQVADPCPSASLSQHNTLSAFHIDSSQNLELRSIAVVAFLLDMVLLLNIHTALEVLEVAATGMLERTTPTDLSENNGRSPIVAAAMPPGHFRIEGRAIERSTFRQVLMHQSKCLPPRCLRTTEQQHAHFRWIGRE